LKQVTIYEKLGAIQQALNAPKSQFNSFGNYKYRSCEDVLAALKPLLAEYKCVLLLKDGIETAEGRVYIKATATLVDVESAMKGAKELYPDIAVSAFAREEETKKGMDASQVTGAASSYARKYALNGLFCIDDNKDSDFTNSGTQGEEKPAERKQAAQQKVEGAVCRDCGAPIPGNVLKWSTEKYGIPLCRDCQKRH
jgi:hypothetical protein